MSVLLGICLSAAAGFRIFIPFLVLSVTSYLGWIDYGSAASWLVSLPFLIGFGFVAAMEIAIYYNPWIDNMLDLISTPLSFFAGVILMLSVMPDINFILKCVIGIVCGGGTALNIRLLSLKARALSSFFITGIGNRIITTIETVSSVIISILAIYTPFAAVILVCFIVFYFLKMIKSVDVKARH